MCRFLNWGNKFFKVRISVNLVALYRHTNEGKQSKIVLNNFIIQLKLIKIYFTACSSIQLIRREKYMETLLTSIDNGNSTDFYF